MADLDRAAFVAEAVASLEETYGDAVVVTWVDALRADLVFYDMIPGRVSARPEGLVAELLVGPPDGPGQPWEPVTEPWDSEVRPAVAHNASQRLEARVGWSVPEDYLETVFARGYTREKWSSSWTRKVKEGS